MLEAPTRRTIHLNALVTPKQARFLFPDPEGYKRLRDVGLLVPIEGGATFYPFSTAERNSQLTNFVSRALFGGAHTADPGDTGASEVAGGVPPYARQALTWGAAAAGSVALAASPTFNIPSLGSGAVEWVSFWNLVTAGVYGGACPANNGEGATPFTCPTATPGVFTSDNHGLTNGMQAVVFDTEVAVLPGGFTQAVKYFVVNATTDTFQLSATSGGVGIAASSDGAGFVQRILPQPFPTAGQLTVGSITIAALR